MQDVVPHGRRGKEACEGEEVGQRVDVFVLGGCREGELGEFLEDFGGCYCVAGAAVSWRVGVSGV